MSPGHTQYAHVLRLLQLDQLAGMSGRVGCILVCSNVFAVCQHSFIDEPRGFSRPDGLRVNMMIARSLCLVALDALFTSYCPCVSYELSQLMLAIHC